MKKISFAHANSLTQATNIYDPKFPVSVEDIDLERNENGAPSFKSCVIMMMRPGGGPHPRFQMEIPELARVLMSRAYRRGLSAQKARSSCCRF